MGLFGIFFDIAYIFGDSITPNMRIRAYNNGGEKLMIVELVMMDITKIGSKADAIVNAANSRLAPGAGVCGAIFSAAGYNELSAACASLGRCRPGEAKATKGFRLPNPYIIHAVGPIYDEDPHPAETLANVYINSLNLAESLGLTSIAFPSISTGIYGYPIKEAAEIVAKTFASYKATSLQKVFMCIYFDDRDYNAYLDAFRRYGLV